MRTSCSVTTLGCDSRFMTANSRASSVVLTCRAAASGSGPCLPAADTPAAAAAGGPGEPPLLAAALGDVEIASAAGHGGAVVNDRCGGVALEARDRGSVQLPSHDGCCEASTGVHDGAEAHTCALPPAAPLAPAAGQPAASSCDTSADMLCPRSSWPGACSGLLLPRPQGVSTLKLRRRPPAPAAAHLRRMTWWWA
jgi:hypothetical protein